MRPLRLALGLGLALVVLELVAVVLELVVAPDSVVEVAPDLAALEEDMEDMEDIEDMEEAEADTHRMVAPVDGPGGVGVCPGPITTTPSIWSQTA